MRFSTLTGVKDDRPNVHELTWQAFADALLPYEFREHKEAGALFSPAELLGGREKHNVQAVHFGVLDLDGDVVQGPNGKKVHGGVPNADFLSILNLAEPYDSFTYTTWSQPFASSRNALCARLVVPWSRPVLLAEWPTVRARFVAAFGGKSDARTDDPTRVFFTPSLPTGFEWAASTWRAEGWQGGARTWDVDAALAAGPVLATKAPVILDARDPIPRDAVVRLATRLSKSADPQAIRLGIMIRAGLDGHRLAEPGSRRDAIRDLTWRLAQAFPTGSAASLLDYFRLSLQFMIGEGVDSDPFEQFTKLLEDGQRKVGEYEQAKVAGTTGALTKRITIAWQGEGMMRSHPYTNEELAAWEAVAPLHDRWILQAGSGVWLFFAGSYVGPFMREAIGPACAQWLAPAVSGGVDCYRRDEKGTPKLKDLHDLVGSYGRVCTVVEADMTASGTYLDAHRKAIVEAPCPLRKLDPAFDSEVDEWLQLLAGSKYSRLCDWLATCTWLRECAPAVFLKGASGAGKNLFASGVARLWSVAGFTPAEHALGQFNASVTECPLVYADERVPENWKGEPRTEELRALITTSTFKINQKNRPLVTCYGSARVVIGANNFGIISRKADFTPEDAQALADRFIVIDVGTIEHCPARDWLIAHGGATWGAAVVNGDRLARHALWLRDQVQTGARALVRGGRMVVPGDASELVQALQTGSRVPWNVLSWVWSFLQDPTKHVAASVGRPFAALVHDGRVWLEPALLARAWDHYLPGEKAPTLEQIKHAARGMLHPENEGRLRRGPGGKVKYRALRLEQLRTWAAQEDVSEHEITTALAVDTEKLGVPGRVGSSAN